MPELAEVLYFSRRWAPALKEKVVRVHLHDQKRVFRGVPTAQLRSTLPGQPLRAIQTHGKQMLFRFGLDRWLGIHLGMTGKLSTRPPDHLPLRHDHLILYTRTHALVFQDPRLFGRIRFHRSRHPPAWWSSLPSPILGRDFSASRLGTILKQRGRTPLKPLLLHQEFFRESATGWPTKSSGRADSTPAPFHAVWRRRRFPGFIKKSVRSRGKPFGSSAGTGRIHHGLGCSSIVGRMAKNARAAGAPWSGSRWAEERLAGVPAARRRLFLAVEVGRNLG